MFFIFLSTLLSQKSLNNKKSIFEKLFVFSILLSKRTLSVFVLRLFNDCFSVSIGLFSIFLLFLSFENRNSSRIRSMFFDSFLFVYSLSVSAKANTLLWAPGVFFVVYTLEKSFFKTVHKIFLFCGVPQLALGLPFLEKNPIGYLKKSVELSRVFQYKWTVNLKFLPENIFLSKELSLALLLLTFFTWFLLYTFVWKNFERPLNFKTAYFVILSSNFVGIVFSRTLHYQFYVWYSFSAPFLLLNSTWFTEKFEVLNNLYRICILFCIEFAYNFPPRLECSFLKGFGVDFCDNPATWASSLLLQLAHFSILVGIFRNCTLKAKIDKRE